MGDKNPIRTLVDYSKPSHKCYRNTIKLPEENNVVPLRSDTIRLVQNGCSFHELSSEDPNQHLTDFLKLVDSLDIDVANRERTRIRDKAPRYQKRQFHLAGQDTRGKSTKDEAILDDISGKPDKSKEIVSPKEFDKENEAKNATGDNLVKRAEEKLKKIDKEKSEETPNS
nr:MAK10-like protein [Tanacetum cinerariifolium]